MLPHNLDLGKPISWLQSPYLLNNISREDVHYAWLECFRGELLNYNDRQFTQLFQVTLYSPSAFKTPGFQQIHAIDTAIYQQKVNDTYTNCSNAEREALRRSAFRAGNPLLVETLSELDTSMTLSRTNIIDAMKSGNTALLDWLFKSPRFKRERYSMLSPEVYGAIPWVSDQALRGRLMALYALTHFEPTYEPTKAFSENICAGSLAGVKSSLDEIATRSLAEKLARYYKVSPEDEGTILQSGFFRALETNHLQIALYILSRMTQEQLKTTLARIANLEFRAAHLHNNILAWLLQPSTIDELNSFDQSKSKIINRDSLIAAFFRSDTIAVSIFEYYAWGQYRYAFLLLWQLASPLQRLEPFNRAEGGPRFFWHIAKRGWEDIVIAYWNDASIERRQTFKNHLIEFMGDIFLNLVKSGNLKIFNLAWGMLSVSEQHANMTMELIAKLYGVALARRRALVGPLENIAKALKHNLTAGSKEVFAELIEEKNLEALQNYCERLTPAQLSILSGNAFFTAAIEADIKILRQLRAWITADEWQSMRGREEITGVLFPLVKNGSVAVLHYLQTLAPELTLTFSRLNRSVDMVNLCSPPVFLLLINNGINDENLAEAFRIFFNRLSRWSDRHVVQQLLCSNSSTLTPLLMANKGLLHKGLLSEQAGLKLDYQIRNLHSLANRKGIKKLLNFRYTGAYFSLYYHALSAALLSDNLPMLVQLIHFDKAMFDKAYLTFVSKLEQFKPVSNDHECAFFASTPAFYQIHLYFVEKAKMSAEKKRYDERLYDFAKLLSDLQALINKGEQCFMERIVARIAHIEPLTMATVHFLGLSVSTSRERYRNLRHQLDSMDPATLLHRTQQYLALLLHIATTVEDLPEDTVLFAKTLLEKIVELTPSSVAELEQALLMPRSISAALPESSVADRGETRELPPHQLESTTCAGP